MYESIMMMTLIIMLDLDILLKAADSTMESYGTEACSCGRHKPMACFKTNGLVSI